ncbi:hypothetical protein KY335_05530 [Candidatus Woesearchaeota archaeon]|nr:hypothetical protein [Candidatus Woesearchaeota archaeon]
MEDSQYGLYSMFSRGYNFLRKKSFGILGAAGLGAAFLGLGTADVHAQEAGMDDISDVVDEVMKEDTKDKDEASTRTDVKSENQRKFAEVYEEMRRESDKEKEDGYFTEARVRGSSNRETGYESWRATAEIGKLAWPGSRWNGRLSFDYEDTDGREERLTINGMLDYKFNDSLTAGFKAFGGNHGGGAEGRVRLTFDLGDVWKGMLYARGGGSYDEDTITDIEGTGLLDSDQRTRRSFGELGLKLSSKDGPYLSISNVFNWLHSELMPNTPSSVSSDFDLETNAVIASLGLRKPDYSIDLTGIWTHTRSKDNLAVEDTVDREDIARLQATGFYHFRGDGHSIGLMVGGDKNGWDVRGIYVFQKGRNDLARELERLKTEKDEISRQEIQDRLEALSSVSLLVHKIEAGGRRNEVPGVRGWEVFGNYQLTVSMRSSILEQLSLGFEATYGEINPTYGMNQRYVRGRANAEARFGKGLYTFAELEGTSYEDRLPSWTGLFGFGKRF